MGSSSAACPPPGRCPDTGRRCCSARPARFQCPWRGGSCSAWFGVLTESWSLVLAEEKKRRGGIGLLLSFYRCSASRVLTGCWRSTIYSFICTTWKKCGLEWCWCRAVVDTWPCAGREEEGIGKTRDQYRTRTIYFGCVNGVLFHRKNNSQSTRWVLLSATIK